MRAVYSHSNQFKAILFANLSPTPPPLSKTHSAGYGTLAQIAYKRCEGRELSLSKNIFLRVRESGEGVKDKLANRIDYGCFERGNPRPLRIGGSLFRGESPPAPINS